MARTPTTGTHDELFASLIHVRNTSAGRKYLAHYATLNDFLLSRRNVGSLNFPRAIKDSRVVLMQNQILSAAG